MRRLFILTMLLLLPVAVRATDKTITGLVTTGIYRGSDTTVVLRIYSSDTFTTSDGKVVIGGSVDSPNFYLSVTCPVSGGVVSCPSFTLPSTTDSSRPMATYTGSLYTGTKLLRLAVLFANWRLSHTLPAIVTYQAFEADAATRPQPLGDTYPTSAQVDAKINSALSVGNPATTSQLGRTKLTATPADPANPLAVGDNDPRLAPSAGDRTCYEAEMIATDVGSRINACDVALGSSKGTIIMTGGGVITSQVHISPYHTLRLETGNYTATVSNGIFLLDDNTAFVSDNWGATIAESTAQAGVYSYNFLVVAAYRNYSTQYPNGSGITQNIRVSGIHIIGGARNNFDSSSSSISLANCHNCQITNNWIDHTHTMGIVVGGGNGTFLVGHDPLYYAQNVLVKDNLLTGVPSQNLGVVNGVNIQVIDNHIIAPGAVGGPGSDPIDLEPNVGDWLWNVRVAGNTIDATDSNSLTVFDGINVQNTNASTRFGNIDIDSNKLYGTYPSSTNSGYLLFSGIRTTAANSGVVTIENNVITRSSRGILLDAGSSGVVVRNNIISDCGSGGGTYPLMIVNSSNNLITGNVLRQDPQNGYFASLDFGSRATTAAIYRTIAESGTSNNNSFVGNYADTIMTVGAGTTHYGNYHTNGTSYEGISAPTFGQDPAHQNTVPLANGDTFALLNAPQTLNNKAISGGSIDAAVIGATSPADATVNHFTTLSTARFGNYVDIVGLGGAPALSGAGNARFYMNSATNRLQLSLNGGAFNDMIGSDNEVSALPGSCTSGQSYHRTTDNTFHKCLFGGGFTQVWTANIQPILATGITVGSGGTPLLKVISGTASLDFTALAANTCEELDVTGFSGLATGDTVSLGLPLALTDNSGAVTNTVFNGFVKNSTTVTVRRCNAGTGATFDPSATNVRVSIFQF